MIIILKIIVTLFISKKSLNSNLCIWRKITKKERLKNCLVFTFLLQSWVIINIFLWVLCLAPFQVYFQIFCTARIYASFAWTLQYLANKYTAHICKLRKVLSKKARFYVWFCNAAFTLWEDLAFSCDLQSIIWLINF